MLLAERKLEKGEGTGQTWIDNYILGKEVALLELGAFARSCTRQLLQKTEDRFQQYGNPSQAVSRWWHSHDGSTRKKALRALHPDKVQYDVILWKTKVHGIGPWTEEVQQGIAQEAAETEARWNNAFQGWNAMERDGPQGAGAAQGRGGGRGGEGGGDRQLVEYTPASRAQRHRRAAHWRAQKRRKIHGRHGAGHGGT